MDNSIAASVPQSHESPVNWGSVKVVNSNVIRPNYLRLGTDEIVLHHPDGSVAPPVKRDYLLSRDAVAVLVFSPTKDQVLLVRQYRHPVFVKTGQMERAYIYEVVAGCVDGDEPIGQTVVREVKEETGIVLSPMKVFPRLSVFPSPGISAERIHLFIGVLEEMQQPKVGGLPEENEKTFPVWLGRDNIQRLSFLNSIEDAKTALLLSMIGWL